MLLEMKEVLKVTLVWFDLHLTDDKTRQRYGYFCKIKFIKYLLKTGHLQGLLTIIWWGEGKDEQVLMLAIKQTVVQQERRELSYILYI